MFLNSATTAQESPAKSSGDARSDREQARAAFEAKFTEWKAGFKALRQFQHDYQEAEDGKHEGLVRQWEETMVRMTSILDELTVLGGEAYRTDPGSDRELTVWLVKRLKDLVSHDQYEQAATLGNILIENGCDDPTVFQEAGMANFSVHNFDKTLALLDKAVEANATTGDVSFLRKSVEENQKLWVTEEKLRAAEAKADDLPRVKLTTDRGEIVIELYENEAPETVGNFIHLVKKGFYDGLTFHRVIAGFMAQAGCPDGDGTGGPGYNIHDECKKPNARMHFRGSLSMAKTIAADSGGSQFFITFRPTENLNTIHTVFGRVIEGIDVVTKLKRRDPEKEDPPEPDKIIKAEVIRDRGHEYLPNKV